MPHNPTGPQDSTLPTDTATVEPLLPPLEQEIDELEELHELRAHAYELRDRGQRSLREHLRGRDTQIDWAPKGNEPDDYIDRSVVLLALSKGKLDAAWRLEEDLYAEPQRSDPLRTIVDELNAIDLHDILQFDESESSSLQRRQYTRSELRQLVRDVRAREPKIATAPTAAEAKESPTSDVLPTGKSSAVNTPDETWAQRLDELDSLLRPKAPVLQATRTLQALLAVPGQALGRGALLSYGTIIHELYTVAPPDRTVGSARTRPGGHHTAFMTSECTRAVAGFARMLDRSADFLEALSALHRKWVALAESDLLPNAWTEQERRRLVLEFSNRINRAWAESAFALREIPPSHARRRAKNSARPRLTDQNGVATPDSVAAFVRSVLGIVAETLTRAATASTGAVREFEKHAELGGTRTGKPDGAISPEAMRSMRDLTEQISECHKLHAAVLGRHSTAGGSKLPSKRLVDEHVLAIARAARKGAEDVRRRLRPASHYLESVLDRELTSAFAANKGVWSPADLACAAAAYGSLNKNRRSADYRLHSARDLLDRALAPDGTFQTQLALELEDSGYTLTLVWSEAIKAFAQVLQIVDSPIQASLVRRLLVKFEKTAVISRGARNAWVPAETGSVPSIAWTHDQPRYPTWAYRWTTALAILALDRIGRMLDVRINGRVQRHFSTRPGHQIDSGLRIESLFYPDYGLATSGPAIQVGDRQDRRESVALLLESMRAHVVGLPAVPGMPRPSVSAVFYGPPGTGKTTLMEALAGSAGVPFVEVTPSDIARTGEQWMERRARAVFKALSFLSHAVVCFDEFEPIIRRRERLAKGSSSGIIDWLTSSMLPKLKLLRERAEKQSVVFSLQTNHLGSIDEAAVRRGRFDHCVGVYPPDVLSRVGRIITALEPYERTLNLEARHRLLEVVGRTWGGAMTGLAKRGFYSPPRTDRGETPTPRAATFHAYILDVNHDGQVDFGTQDADIKRQCPTLEAIKDCKRLVDCRAEWRSVAAWDEALIHLTGTRPLNADWSLVLQLLTPESLSDEVERARIQIENEDRQYSTASDHAGQQAQS